MKPYLMLLLAISLASVKPVQAQNKVNSHLIAQTPAVEKALKEKPARLDTGIISVVINWNSAAWACAYSTVNVIPAASGPGGTPIMSKQINTISTCINSVAFTGLLAGTEVIIEVICNSGLRAYSAPGYVHAGWPPLLLEVSFPK